MPKYVIEREVPGIGKSSAEELREASAKSCGALKQLNGEVQWLESFVTPDKTYCVYIAPSEELVRKHAELSGFPANKISVVNAVIDPSTAEAEFEGKTPYEWTPGKEESTQLRQ